jgi:hypothetical protein
MLLGGAIAAGGVLVTVGGTIATAPLCVTGAGCVAPALTLGGGTLTTAAGVHQWFLALDAIEDAKDDIGKAREAAEVAEASVKNAQEAAQRWKNDNCN